MPSKLLAAKDSFNGCKRGIPPPTLASKEILTLFFSAVAVISSQCFAKSALLAVTTCFPFSRALIIKLRAGS